MTHSPTDSHCAHLRVSDMSSKDESLPEADLRVGIPS